MKERFFHSPLLVRLPNQADRTSMVKFIIATGDNLDLFIKSRLEMLKVVNNLPDDYKFDEELISSSISYLKNANQTTILAMDETVIGCATICYIDILPTFSHPTGKRAHLMNVYTNIHYRKQGIAFQMINILIDNAKKKGVTEISLDATESGRPLYKKFGFRASAECMVLNINLP